MTNLSKAKDILSSGDLSSDTFDALAKLQDTSSSEIEKYQIGDLIEAFLVQGGQVMDTVAMLEKFKAEVRKLK
jgi:hypothetical protein